MKRPQLVELLQRVRANHPESRLMIAGSQALYGTVRVAPAVVELSIEADLLLVREAFQSRAGIEDEFSERCSIRAFASSPLYLPASRASVRVFLPTRSQTGSASW